LVQLACTPCLLVSLGLKGPAPTLPHLPAHSPALAPRRPRPGSTATATSTAPALDSSSSSPPPSATTDCLQHTATARHEAARPRLHCTAPTTQGVEARDQDGARSTRKSRSCLPLRHQTSSVSVTGRSFSRKPIRRAVTFPDCALRVHSNGSGPVVGRPRTKVLRGNRTCSKEPSGCRLVPEVKALALALGPSIEAR